VGTAELRLAVFVAGLIVFAAVERLWPRLPSREPGRRWLFHGLLAVANLLASRLVVALPFLAWAHHVEAKGWGLVPRLGLSPVLSAIVGLVILDGLNYHWHRINHEWPVLWRWHSAHHADDQLDVTTALRFHPIEYFLSWPAKGLWIALVGPSFGTFALFETLVSLAAQFHHANWNLAEPLDRALRYLLPTPRFHAAHHTKAPRSRNGNYGTVLSVWDRAFGTYHDPRAENLADLGLPGPQAPLSPKEFLLRPTH
jgi:sterol desaturase/sphingolipid hydroxylase (fatty acid hydroxylase superfamily)